MRGHIHPRGHRARTHDILSRNVGMNVFQTRQWPGLFLLANSKHRQDYLNEEPKFTGNKAANVRRKKMIYIMLPPFDIEVEADEYEKLPEKEGVYFFFDAKGELLYIGKTNNLLMRMKNHFSSPHSGPLAKYKNKIKKISFFVAENPMERDIYEIYAINTLKPKLNRQNAYYQSKPRMDSETKQKEKKEEKQKETPGPYFYKIDQVAEFLQMEPKEVKKLLKERKLAGYRLPGGQWRISEDQIKEFLNRKTIRN